MIFINQVKEKNTPRGRRRSKNKPQHGGHERLASSAAKKGKWGRKRNVIRVLQCEKKEEGASKKKRERRKEREQMIWRPAPAWRKGERGRRDFGAKGEEEDPLLLEKERKTAGREGEKRAAAMRPKEVLCVGRERCMGGGTQSIPPEERKSDQETESSGGQTLLVAARG